MALEHMELLATGKHDRKTWLRIRRNARSVFHYSPDERANFELVFRKKYGGQVPFGACMNAAGAVFACTFIPFTLGVLQNVAQGIVNALTEEEWEKNKEAVNEVRRKEIEEICYRALQRDNRGIHRSSTRRVFTKPLGTSEEILFAVVPGRIRRARPVARAGSFQRFRPRTESNHGGGHGRLGKCVHESDRSFGGPRTDRHCREEIEATFCGYMHKLPPSPRPSSRTALEPFASLLESKNTKLRRCATWHSAHAAKSLPQEFIANAIRTTIEDKDPKIRAFAIEAIRKFQRKDLISLIKAREKIEDDPQVLDTIRFEMPLIQYGYFTYRDEFHNLRSVYHPTGGGCVDTALPEKNMTDAQIKQYISEHG